MLRLNRASLLGHGVLVAVFVERVRDADAPRLSHKRCEREGLRSRGPRAQPRLVTHARKMALERGHVFNGDRPSGRKRVMTPVVVLLSLFVLVASGCGSRPPTVGVVADRDGLIKTPLKTTASDLERVRMRAINREHRADVMGDDRLETLTALPGGAGLEIGFEIGGQTSRIDAPAYLTDFGAVISARARKKDIIMYVYPSGKDVGTFVLVNPVTGARLAKWDESPPPGRFTVGRWQDVPALFYVQRDSIVIRTPTGRLLRRLPLRGAGRFRDLYVTHHDEGLVVVASGNGYTPYHLVAVYGPAHELVFQEFNREHAFALDIDESRDTFVVTTRTGRWRYGPIPRTEGQATGQGGAGAARP